MYGTVERLDAGQWQLRFTRELAHPIDKVWRAITEPDHLAHWFPTTIDGDRAAGAPLTFAFRENQAPPFAGEMIAFDPPSAIELRWGTDVVRIELRPTADGTELTLLDTLDERGKAARDGAGWHVCLDNLAGYLDDHEASAVWRDVHPHYVDAFGPEAATIGPPEGFE